MTVHAHPRYLIVTDAAVLVLVEALLFGVSRPRVLLSPLAFWLMAAVVLICFALDVAAWYWKGIRAVDVDSDVLTVYRGPSLSARAFPRSAIARLKVIRFPGARAVRLRASSGRRERITEQVFPRDEFTRFLSIVELWER
jgi:hypothetical protein